MLFVVLLSVLVDLCFGEPPSRVHPVVWMGRYLSLKGRLLKHGSPPWLRFVLGVGFVLVGASFCGGLAWWVQVWTRRLPWLLETLLLAPLLKPFFSISALFKAGEVVREALVVGDLGGARRLLAWHLVSRDTEALSESQVAGAAVASLAENLTDSVVAPLLYALLFGLSGAAVYRFVNTADAVLGYRTAELEHFGKFAARADDALNYVPARLAAGLLFFALVLRNGRARPLWREMQGSWKRTPSPNGGWTMALAAAGLGVRLEKRGVYVLNEGGRAATTSDIAETQGLLETALALGLSLYVLITFLVWMFHA